MNLSYIVHISLHYNDILNVVMVDLCVIAGQRTIMVLYYAIVPALESNFLSPNVFCLLSSSTQTP